MARSKSENGRVNKSAAIRDAIAENPQAGSKDIVAILGAKGIKVARTLVYFIRSKQKHQIKLLKRERTAETSKRTGTANPVQLILKVKELAREAGGFRYLKQLVDVMAE